MSIYIEKQLNGLYSITIKEPFIIFFSKRKIIKDLTESQVKNYKVQWGKISLGVGVNPNIFPERFINK